MSDNNFRLFLAIPLWFLCDFTELCALLCSTADWGMGGDILRASARGRVRYQLRVRNKGYVTDFGQADPHHGKAPWNR